MIRMRVSVKVRADRCVARQSRGRGLGDPHVVVDCVVGHDGPQLPVS